MTETTTRRTWSGTLTDTLASEANDMLETLEDAYWKVGDLLPEVTKRAEALQDMVSNEEFDAERFRAVAERVGPEYSSSYIGQAEEAEENAARYRNQAAIFEDMADKLDEAVTELGNIVG